MNERWKACIVPVTGPATACWYDGGMDLFTRAIGEGLLAYTMIDRTVQAYVGDTSVIDGEPVNERLTAERDRILVEAGQVPHPTPICGTAVLLGIELPSGDTVDLPQQWLEDLVPGGRLGWLGDA